MKSFFRLSEIGLSCVLPMFLLLLVSAGCSASKVVVAVKGSVMAQGKPAAGALVLFHPESVPSGQTASGVAAEDGKFALSSGMDQGIAPGKYIVTITWPDPAVKPTAAEMMQGMGEQGSDLLKGAYATRGVSKLRAEITSSTTELPAFEVAVP